MKKALTIIIAIFVLVAVSWILGSAYETYFNACAVWFVPIAKAAAVVTGIFAAISAGIVTYTWNDYMTY